MGIFHRFSRRLVRALLSGICAMTAASATAATDTVRLTLPEYRLTAQHLAVIVNDRDPLSVQIGAYYQRARGIPAGNILHVAFPPGKAVMSRHAFQRIKALVDAQTPAHVQAYALTWMFPWRVECMSVTSAFAFGYDPQLCSAKRCATTRRNPYFNRDSSAPRDLFGIRPTMSIAARTFADARALIDRGVQSDNSRPPGDAYLVITGDKARDVRSVHFANIERRMDDWIRTRIVRSPGLRDTAGILFYFTGAKQVPHLDSLAFRPGAVADHLTSTGGVLSGGRQMSALRWLEAGATGSYGTVVEPCNHLGKFPHPGILMESYGAGRTLLQAYWQSVNQPGEGLFIGEPLAAPFAGHSVTVRENDILLATRALLPGDYRLSVAEEAVGPYRAAGLLKAHYHQTAFVLPRLDAGHYRLEPVPRLMPLHRGTPGSAAGHRGGPTATAAP